MQLSIGDRVPEIIGATAAGHFYSLDDQAGRPALLVILSALPPRTVDRVLGKVRAAAAQIQQANLDVVPLATFDSFSGGLGSHPEVEDRIVYVSDAVSLASLKLGGEPAAILIDRTGRVVDLLGLAEGADLSAWLQQAAHRIVAEPSRRCTSSAPVLIIPNVASASDCEALIAHFEASPHLPGAMAAFADGAAYAKLDETKKRRRDIELAPGGPLHDEVVSLIASRVAPEIKRAFQVNIAFSDRILLARYDDTGGYFKRHRDDAAPHTAFREFAISLNLNTHEYEGGELLFPEFDDHRYSPPAGSAIVFSASLLHEAAPVLKGRRYVLLSFLGGAAAQTKLDAWTRGRASASA